MFIRILCLAVLMIAATTTAQARETKVKWPGPFAVTVVEVRDGDSVLVAVRGNCPFGCERVDRRNLITIRLSGIDTGETRACRRSVTPSCAACLAELTAGIAAKARAMELFDGSAVRVVALKPDKYRGRVVGDMQVLRDGRWQSVGSALLDEGHAVAYDGGRKAKPWCSGASGGMH